MAEQEWQFRVEHEDGDGLWHDVSKGTQYCVPAGWRPCLLKFRIKPKHTDEEILAELRKWMTAPVADWPKQSDHSAWYAATMKAVSILKGEF